jgi:hypothetical protein
MVKAMGYSSPEFRQLGHATSLIRGGAIYCDVDTCDVCTSDKNRVECPDYDED